MNREKFILDACCGSRMFWFNKAHPNAVYMDDSASMRSDETTAKSGL